jgi:undecaprenyl-diphosphatase
MSGAVTWAADEHVLMVAATAAWLLTRRSNRDVQQLATHVLACSLAAALLPHILKTAINQRRPDRLTVEGHLHGVPFSGRAEDAFPSGHAVHLGTVASAATLLQPAWRNSVWLAGGVLAGTRVILLAHWVTVVFAGASLGALVERGIRQFTKPPVCPSSSRHEKSSGGDRSFSM